MKNLRPRAVSPLKAHYAHLIIPKDTDGAYRVHKRLDGLDITTPYQQLAIRRLQDRGG